MALLIKIEKPSVVDLGCGTGELTAELHRYLGARKTTGIDSSEAMLSAARPYETDTLKFQVGRIEEWQPESPVNIVFSNAAFQWCPEHRELFERIAKGIATDGQIAVQMPMNHDYPTHVLANTMSKEGRWSKLLGHEAREQNKTMLTVEEYASLLFNLGFKEQKVFLRVYGHELESRDGVIEWVKGTLMTYFKSRLSQHDYDSFVSEFRDRLFRILPDNMPFFYPFKRALLWGKR